MLGIATGAAVSVLKAAHRLTDAQADAKWIDVDQELVRAEKVEKLGHTIGGISVVTDARAGQLSEPQDQR